MTEIKSLTRKQRTECTKQIRDLLKTSKGKDIELASRRVWSKTAKASIEPFFREGPVSARSDKMLNFLNELKKVNPKKEEDEYSDRFKRKFIMKWKDEMYSTFIDDTYLEDKVLTLDNLEEFFDSIFNKKKFYSLDCYYDFYFCAQNSIQLNVKLEMKINENLKSIKEKYIFILHKIDKRSWFQWFTDIILDRD